MQVVIIGSNGQLGSELMKLFPGAKGLTHKDINIVHLNAWREIPVKADVVINTAAMHNVVECEHRVSEAFELNYSAVWRLARVLQPEQHFIHISTNMVFNGKKWGPYTVTDSPDPLNVYGYSKFAGECAIRDQRKKFSIVRFGPIYGGYCRAKNGATFLSQIMEKALTGTPIEVNGTDFVNPISVVDAALQIATVAKLGLKGIIHGGSSDYCTWYQFARAIVERMARCGLPVHSAVHLGGRDLIRRPEMGALEINMPGPRWEDSLDGYFKRYEIPAQSRDVVAPSCPVSDSRPATPSRPFYPTYL